MVIVIRSKGFPSNAFVNFFGRILAKKKCFRDFLTFYKTKCPVHSNFSFLVNVTKKRKTQLTRNPDFSNFTEVANALNNSGVSCPVTFVVRDGVYEEQINIVNVPGNSLVNTVTFLGESGDSSLVTLSYSDANNILDYTLNLENTYGFTFEDIGFSRGNNSYIIKATNSNSLKVDRCHFHSNGKNLGFETGTDIHFSNSYFTRNHFYLSDSIYGFSLEHNIGLGHFDCQNSSYVDSLYIYNNTFPHGNNFRFGRY